MASRAAVDTAAGGSYAFGQARRDRHREPSTLHTVPSLLLSLTQEFAVAAPDETALVYPKTGKVEIAEDRHGIRVVDPYRWLEEDVRNSADVRAWVEAQNEVTFGYLRGIGPRDRIRKRLTELVDYERFASPFVIAGRYYYFHNDGLQNQSVLYSLGSLDGEPELILDPNTWSDDGTVALQGLSVSDDGRYIAYAKAAAGSDWTEWSVRDLEAGDNLPDQLRWTKFTTASWTPDSKGFFYARFDEPASGEEFQALNTNQKVYYHRLRTPQTEDVLAYARPDEPTWGFSPVVSEDGRYLIVHIWQGTDPRNRVYYRNLLEPYAMPTPLVDHFENEFEFIGNDGSTFFFKTDLGAPNGRVIAVDVRKPDPAHYREVIPESRSALQSIGMTANVFVANYLQDVTTQIKMFRPDGHLLREVALPGKGTAGGFSGKRSDTETFFTYTTFNTPAAIYHYDMLTGASTLWKQPEVKFAPNDYVVEQVFYESKDGTRVPMFITHKTDLPLDGRRPTLLYGYGGFGVSLTPGFSALLLPWLEMGGVYAQANLRGGGEYGLRWHEAGKLAAKQNVFDDFIAAAEWLIGNGYTSREKLAIQGGSNGGLLVGAVMTQRPELFRAALPDVGVLDMLRFHRFTAGRYWVDEYGSADDPEQFETLYAYSPYHNLKPAHYPATLITTADTDDRVVPGHSFKFAARLQEMQTGDAPALIRIETRAGHGGGKPIEKVIEEVADQYAFLVQNLFDDPDSVSASSER
jgi:prolyl oligopeptidase